MRHCLYLVSLATIGLALMHLSISSQQAHAADIETLIMPGEVIKMHADLEKECSNCHKAFNRSEQMNLCLDCHEDVQTDIRVRSGFHGLFDEVSGTDCAECHTDHIGRGGDIVDLDEGDFDHKLTDFLLQFSHVDAECADCHLPDEKFRDAAGDCIGCHKEDDDHDGDLGEACGDCHVEKTWQDITFDHSQTEYPLVGKHETVVCIDCHIDNLYEGTADDCFSCHADDDEHNGLSGENCGNCHSPTSWDDTSFDHQRDTELALAGGHADLACTECHSEEPFSDELDVNCISCHEDDDDHDGHFGPDCGNCHAEVEWKSGTFDHDLDTDYPLKGAHADTDCIGCHVEPIYDVALESGCNSCHADDDVHEGTQGTDCVECHNVSSWTDDVFFDHDLTRFPLLGKHLDEECDACHETQKFEDAATACRDCHQEDEPHDGRFGEVCEGCHNPVDWQIWFFDHNLQTDFELQGAHVSVACNDCHRQSIKNMIKLSVRCGECHRSNDVHDGEFGANCERCHSAESFKDVRMLQ
jgi:hypothetical protein